MDIIVILVVSVVFIIMLALLFKVNRKSIIAIKRIGENKELNDIACKLPENEEICTEILKMMNNENVKIKISDSKNDASLYVVANNSILISNENKSFARVQTIAHECIHSKQDKALLWFNFVFTNIYGIYFVIITVLTLFKVIQVPEIYAKILVAMAVVLYAVRSFLENDAMLKAKHVAKRYLENKTDIVTKEEIAMLVNGFDKINENGIKLYNFALALKFFSKVILYCIIAIIISCV